MASFDENIHESHTKLAQIGSLYLGIVHSTNFKEAKTTHFPVLRCYLLNGTVTIYRSGDRYDTFEEAKEGAARLLSAFIKEQKNGFVDLWSEGTFMS